MLQETVSAICAPMVASHVILEELGKICAHLYSGLIVPCPIGLVGAFECQLQILQVLRGQNTQQVPGECQLPTHFTMRCLFVLPCCHTGRPKASLGM